MNHKPTFHEQLICFVFLVIILMNSFLKSYKLRIISTYSLRHKYLTQTESEDRWTFHFTWLLSGPQGGRTLSSHLAHLLLLAIYRESKRGTTGLFWDN